MGKAAKQKFLRRQAHKQVAKQKSSLEEEKRDQASESEEAVDACSSHDVSNERLGHSFPSLREDSEITILSQEKLHDPLSLSLPEEQVSSFDTLDVLIAESQPDFSVEQRSEGQKEENVLNRVPQEVPLQLASQEEEVSKQLKSNASLDIMEASLRFKLKEMPSHHGDRGNILYQLCRIVEKRGFIPQALELSTQAVQLLPNRSDCAQLHQLLQKAMQSYSGTVDQDAEMERVSALEVLGELNWKSRETARQEEDREKAVQAVTFLPRKIARSHSSTPWQRTDSFTSSMILTQHSGISKPLFNSTHEYRLYKVLLERFPLHFVYPNMALQSIFYFKQMKLLLDPATFEYFLKAHVDICLIRSSDYYPVLAIELDSTVHDGEEAIHKDGLKDLIFRQGGVDLLRLRPLVSYSDEEMRREVIDLLEQWDQHSQHGVGSEHPMMETEDESLEN